MSQKPTGFFSRALVFAEGGREIVGIRR